MSTSTDSRVRILGFLHRVWNLTSQKPPSWGTIENERLLIMGSPSCGKTFELKQLCIDAVASGKAILILGRDGDWTHTMRLLDGFEYQYAPAKIVTPQPAHAPALAITHPVYFNDHCDPANHLAAISAAAIEELEAPLRKLRRIAVTKGIVVIVDDLEMWLANRKVGPIVSLRRFIDRVTDGAQTASIYLSTQQATPQVIACARALSIHHYQAFRSATGYRHLGLSAGAVANLSNLPPMVSRTGSIVWQRDGSMMWAEPQALHAPRARRSLIDTSRLQVNGGR